MPTFAANLKTRLDAIGVELAAIASTAIVQKSDAGGTRKGTLEGYRLQLVQEARGIIETLASLGYAIDAGGALSTTVAEVISQGTV